MKNRNLLEDNNWATPLWFYDKLNEEFDFNFDPCPYTTKPITEENDGLLIEWGERNYCNPPYSLSTKTAFVNKALIEAQKGKLCVLLLPVATSTKLFWETIVPNAKEIRLVKGRIKFEKIDEHGNRTIPKNGGQHDSMIVVFDGRKADVLFHPSKVTLAK
jgi:site-specific DNA-methyltransferase (adenine-specific)